MYLNKKAVLKWAESEMSEHQDDAGYRTAMKWLLYRLERGAFDADNSEVQRLRAALERIKKWAEDPEPGTMYKIWKLANETLKGDGNE